MGPGSGCLKLSPLASIQNDSAPARVLPGMKTPALGFLTVGICEAQNLVFSTVERPVAL